jgi:hypothetical protein
MKRAVLLLALAGCNEVYGLAPTTVVDAQFFDAPTMCPTYGGPFALSDTLEQLLYDCTDYAEAGARAVALCRDSTGYQPHGGPLHGPFTPIAELPRSGITASITSFKLAPDGTLLLVRLQNVVQTWNLVGDTWIRGADIANAPGVVSNPSLGPERRILGGVAGSTVLRELSDASGSWQEIRTHSLATDVESAVPIWLSGDALRLIVLANTKLGIGTLSMRYSERATTSDLFQTLQPLTLPPSLDVFVTEDCTRAYFSGLRTIFYARRI